MEKAKAFYENNFKVFFYLVFSALIYLAWFNRFLQDDSYIVFRYAYNLAKGNGLVWNIGQRVEGYTTFLYTLIMSVPIYFGLDVGMASFILGLFLFAVSLFFTYRLSLFIFDREISLIAVFLLGTNYTFSIYATGGLGTQLQTSTFVISFYILLNSLREGDWGWRKMSLLSLSLSAALLTRLDSGLLVLVVFPIAVFFIIKTKHTQKESLIALAMPLVILVGGWLVWKVYYYGDIFPNTYYVKVGTAPPFKRGISFVRGFIFSYLLVPFPIFFLAAFKQIISDKSKFILLSFSGLICLWLGYIVRIGGGFMEYRFMVPILPFVFIIITWLLFVFIKQRELRLALIVLIILGYFHHVIADTEIEPLRIKSVGRMDPNWTPLEDIGNVLGKSLNYSKDVTIAVTGAGVIPYISRLRSIDMHGLNDKWIAKNGRIVKDKPGHTRVVRLEYLIKRKVNLIVANPFRVKKRQKYKRVFSANDRIVRMFYFGKEGDKVDKYKLPPDSKMLEMPIDKNHNLLLLYLIKSPVVDAAIKKGNWKTYPIVID